MERGSKVGRYELGEQIGEGAIAVVFESVHPVLERRVAIKILKKGVCGDAQYVARFVDDARSAAGLDHPNVVRVLDVDDAGDQPFIVMERVDGWSLDRWLAGRRVEIAEAARIGRDVARALAAAHRNGLVHRDVKPSNILIERETGVAKLTDFGAAKRERPSDQQLTIVGQRIGTPRYMAPEQVEGSAVDARTDLFALGATLYEVLTGRPAFEGDTVAAVYHAILFGEPRALAELRPDAPAELGQLIHRLLAKKPDARPGSSEEVAAIFDALEASMAETGQSGGEETTKTWWGGVMDRSRLVPVAAGVALLVAIAIGGWWLSGSDEQQTADPEISVAADPQGGTQNPADELARQDAAEEPQEGTQAPADELARQDAAEEPQENTQAPADELAPQDATEEPQENTQAPADELARQDVAEEPQEGTQAPADELAPQDVAEEPQEGTQAPADELAQDQAAASAEEDVAARTEPAAPGQTQIGEREEAEAEEDESGAASPKPAGEEGVAVPDPEVSPTAAPTTGATGSGGAAGRVEQPENTTDSLAAAGKAAAPEPTPTSPAGVGATATGQPVPGPEDQVAAVIDKPVLLPEVPAETLDCPGDPAAAPGCALAAEALRAVGASPGPALKVKLNRQDGVYLDQDYLVVETRLPAEVGGYLYLDVLTDAGQVYHLLPEELRKYNALGAGGYIRVGVEESERRDGVRHWQVGAPFGEGYLLALLTEKRLYQGVRPTAEALVDYRNVLLGGLADAGRTSAEIVQLEFRQRE